MPWRGYLCVRMLRAAREELSVIEGRSSFVAPQLRNLDRNQTIDAAVLACNGHEWSNYGLPKAAI